MATVISRAAKVRVLMSLVLCITGGWFHVARAQTNSWTNSASGNWEDSYWSLGVLPGTNQAILFTNVGLNVLTIGPNTAQNFPETMSVDSVTIAPPAGSAHILLLNDAGFQTPFTANQFNVASNAMTLLYSSSLQVEQAGASGIIEVDGTLIQDASSLVSDYYLDVSGTYHLNSGQLTSAGETLVGPSAKFVQSGGSNLMQGGTGPVWNPYNISQPAGSNSRQGGTEVFANAEYDLVNGQFTGDVVLFEGSVFNQSGGRVTSQTVFPIDGTFIQSGGIFEGPTGELTQLPTFLYGDNACVASILQTGGTNTQIGLILGMPWLGPYGPDTGGGGCPAITVGSSGSYTLSDGVLNTGGVTMGPKGSFTQSGGLHTINGDLSIHGEIIIFYEHFTTNWRVDCNIISAYSLNGGILSVRNVKLGGHGGDFLQSGGTNEISGSLIITNVYDAGYYGMSDGLLAVSNIASQGGSINQYGGEIMVGDFQSTGNASFIQTGGNIIQSGLLTLAGTWQSGPGDQQLGQLQFSAASVASLLMPNAPGSLRFRDSSSLTWANGLRLSVQNWSGSLYGGGQQQIIFGTNAAALTTQQLSQIQFQNPTGLAPGNYPARILTTGEIVPDTGAPLPPMANLVCATNGLMRLSIGGDIGATYSIEVSTDLVHWNTWTDQFNTCGTMTLDDNDSTSCPQRFYRAHLMP